jgi:chaperonin GroEL (HSP60 family)
MEVSIALREYAPGVGGREQMAIEAFADAMEVLPRTLAENAGLDPIDTLIDLRKEHKKGKVHAGVNVFTGKITDMLAQKVLEPIGVGTQAIISATDASVMILRIDDVIAAKTSAPMPSGGEGMGGPGGMGGMGGMGDGEF